MGLVGVRVLHYAIICYSMLYYTMLGLSMLLELNYTTLHFKNHIKHQLMGRADYNNRGNQWLLTTRPSHPPSHSPTPISHPFSWNHRCCISNMYFQHVFPTHIFNLYSQMYFKVDLQKNYFEAVFPCFICKICFQSV